ncbi:TetR/AcrR family transcriptional regulator [Streptomyces sp. 71268]|uniref:TetR/AcrR family transcriptional regulator n=1 Tax=Streptomyces sp. 71268 TaxID=3002640 RepID=UPI0023F7A2B9|nr:TetR/AcrR family transcriptional regulator [Streptomyces sp. 71268]WEV25420.1 TetR/AcrR family transcriptional regulator [Streptomyces sp. 71268]
MSAQRVHGPREERRGGAVGRPAGRLAAKREAILQAAVEIFLREGYDRASVDAIAEEAGVSKQTIYNHFGGKERLFLAAVEGERDRVATRFAAPSPTAPAGSRAGALAGVEPPGGSPGGEGPPVPTPAPGGVPPAPADARTALAAYGRQVLTVLLDERASALRRLIIAEAGRYPSLRPACAHGEPESLVTAGADLLRRRTESGELAVPDPSGAARQLVALLVQRGLHASTYGTQPLAEEEAATLCEEAAELFVRAYRA